jgi:hypothetical protein
MRSQPIHVRLSSFHVNQLWFRQTPNNDGVWDHLRFHLDDEDVDGDWLVAFDEPQPSLRTTVPRQRRILFVTEPPGIKEYPARYANQFGVAVTPYPIAGFRGRAFIQQSALNWHYGVDLRDARRPTATALWDELAADKPKSKLASIVCSTKVALPYQRCRVAFVERLAARLGDRVDAFGRGMRPIDDKRDAIAPYKYHIALENNLIDNFWTEKLADAYLGDAFPIFAGCANIEDYFDPQSLRRIDIRDPDRAIDEVARILDSTLWEDNRARIREARRRLMTEHNFFPVVAKVIAQCGPSALAAAPVARAALKPAKRRGLKRFRKRLRAFVGGLFGR